jgi:predicted CXXCH cytochrome family protein
VSRTSTALTATACLVAVAIWLGATTPADDETDHQQPATTQTSSTDANRPATVDENTSRLVAGLIGSAHDFTQDGEQGRNLCLPCHTPHLVDAPAPQAGEERPVEPLRPYRDQRILLDGWTMMCLGCHDGVAATDVFSDAHALTFAPQAGRPQLRAGATSSHPVGIRYPRGSVEDYHPASAVLADGLPLPDGRIQCVTCHDPHNAGGHAGMLQISNERSRLCLSCHDL